MSPLIIDQYSSDSSTSSSPTRQPRTRSFSVSWAKYEDIRRLVDIEFFAFEHEKTNHILSYRDHHTPAHLQRAVRSYQSLISKAAAARRHWKSTQHHQHRRTKPDLDTARFRKIVDADSGSIISWAKTEYKAYTKEELASPEDSGHEGEAQMNRDWFALNERLRRQYMGMKRHCYVGMVATLPAYQHHGAGTMLLEDILAEADASGVECYLEATDTAKPLYERHGFVTVNELRFDPAHYGIYGYNIERQTIMVRGALNRSGQRQQVRSWEEAVPGVQMQASAQL